MDRQTFAAAAGGLRSRHVLTRLRPSPSRRRPARGSPSRPPGPSNRRAVRTEAAAAIEKLGGKVFRDGTLPAEPVIGVDLDETGATDEALAVLESFPRLQHLSLDETANHRRRAGPPRAPPRADRHLPRPYRHRRRRRGPPARIGGSPQADAGPHRRHRRRTGAPEGLAPAGDALLDRDEGHRCRTGPPGRVAARWNGSSSTPNAITDAGLVHLKGLRNLEYLLLNKTAVTDEGLRQLAGLKQLELRHAPRHRA